VLSFGTEETQLSFQISNIGGGVLDVGAITDDAPWLSLVEVPSSGGETDVGSVTCIVDRTGLAAGDYSATVTVNALNGTVPSATVPSRSRSCRCPSSSTSTSSCWPWTRHAGDRAAAGRESDDGALLPLHRPAGGRLPDRGRSDDDGSNTICDPTDLYCGLYPTVNEPEVIHFGGGDIHGLNFVVGPTAGGPASTTAHRTYALLH
jgi:hypothetical protein